MQGAVAPIMPLQVETPPESSSVAADIKAEDMAVDAKDEKDEKAETTAPESQPAIYNVNLETKPPSAEKFADGMVQETAPLKRGPDGMLVASFSGVDHKFEVPNITLDRIVQSGGVPGKPKKTKAKGKGKTRKKANGKAKGKVKAKAKARRPRK